MEYRCIRGLDGPPKKRQPWSTSRTVFKLSIFCLVSALVIVLFGVTAIWIYLKSDPEVSSTYYSDHATVLFNVSDEDYQSFCEIVPDELKFDCLPQGEISESFCLQRNCCWQVPNNLDEEKSLPLNIPYCYYPSFKAGYTLDHVNKSLNRLDLVYTRSAPSGYPNDMPKIQLQVLFVRENILRIKIFDPDHERYEVPFLNSNMSQSLQADLDFLFEFEYSNSSGFRVIRKSNGEIIFDCIDVGSLIFADQFLQISSLLPSDNIYGLGEHQDSLRLSTNWKKITLFNLDQIPTEKLNLYGSHPFYFVMENTGLSHGVFLLNSNAMDIILQPSPAITFRTIGGIFDFFIFLGPSPKDVIRDYQHTIGLPFMPPYWSLGFHLCRFMYGTANQTKTVWQRTRDAGIPFDVQWNDIDYMDKNKDFSFDEIAYKELPEFVDEIHNAGMHYVVITDPGISGAEQPNSYPPFDDGIDMDVFIKNNDGSLFIGKVWNPVSTVWPDFTHPNATKYWTKQIETFHSKIPADGLWIDMNEPSNFYSGTKDGCPDNPLEQPPYLPEVHGSILYYHTVCMSAQQYLSTHYNVHNLYGLTETQATSMALKEIRQKRPFVISRSTFPGQGAYGGHWTGDVWSTWHAMAKSIPAMLNFNFFGIPMVGADICGFNGNTTASLCGRWSQLGAFYPFSRNHNEDSTIDQDPVALGEDVVLAAKNALTVRYRLLPYLYTLFWRAHAFGETVVRPLFFEFPYDKLTYGIDTCFMWGRSLLIIPVLQENQTYVEFYLPAHKWYYYHTGKYLKSRGELIRMEAPIHLIPILLRGGNILVRQEPAVTTTQSRLNPFHLLVALDEIWEATGELYWDDGDSIGSWENGEYNLITYRCLKNTLTATIEHWGYENNLRLIQIVILGVTKKVKKVKFNGVSRQFNYNPYLKKLTVQGLSSLMAEPFTLRWTD